MRIVLPLLSTFSAAIAVDFDLQYDLELIQVRAQLVTDDVVARDPSEFNQARLMGILEEIDEIEEMPPKLNPIDSNASVVFCQRPNYFCTDEYFGTAYENRDCDGDGTLDHKCTTLDDDRMWLVLSTEGCPGVWGTSKRQWSECKPAFANKTSEISFRVQQLSDDARQEIPDTAPLSEEGYQEVAALEDDEAMIKFARRQLETVGLHARRQDDLRAWALAFNGTKANQSFAAMVDSLEAQGWVFRRRQKLSKIAPLTEDGYRDVADLEDDEDMLIFARRQLDALGMRARKQDDLKSMIPWFSGTKAKQSLAAMVNEFQTRDGFFRTSTVKPYDK